MTRGRPRHPDAYPRVDVLTRCGRLSGRLLGRLGISRSVKYHVSRSGAGAAECERRRRGPERAMADGDAAGRARWGHSGAALAAAAVRAVLMAGGRWWRGWRAGRGDRGERAWDDAARAPAEHNADNRPTMADAGAYQPPGSPLVRTRYWCWATRRRCRTLGGSAGDGVLQCDGPTTGLIRVWWTARWPHMDKLFGPAGQGYPYETTSPERRHPGASRGASPDRRGSVCFRFCRAKTPVPPPEPCPGRLARPIRR
jgi:hypothetical protein